MILNNLLITDDHAFLTEGIVSTLKEEFSIPEIIVCHSPEEAIKQASDKKFDLYILDIGFRSESNIDMRCIDYIHKIGKINPQAKIIVYTMHEDFAMVSFLSNLKQVKGIVLKGPEKKYLLEAVETVLKGEQYLCPRFKIIYKKSKEYRERLKKRKLVNGMPTDKELSIIRMIAVGKNSEQIALALGHTVSTIESYRRDLKLKFDVSNTVDLILTAIMLNFISLDEVILDLLE